MTNSHARRRRGARAGSPAGGGPGGPAGPAAGRGAGSPAPADKFAGARWGEAPAACALPRPPARWVPAGGRGPARACLALKLLLQVA